MERDFAVIVLWQVLAVFQMGSVSDRQIMIFDSVGWLRKIFSMLRYLRDQVRDAAHFEESNFLTDQTNPRDFFGVRQMNPAEDSSTFAAIK